MFKKLNARVKKLSLADIKLLNLAVFFATIVLIKLVPALLKLDVWLLAILAIIFLAKPFYSFWLKKK
jgi:hypothetical protein